MIPIALYEAGVQAKDHATWRLVGARTLVALGVGGSPTRETSLLEMRHYTQHASAALLERAFDALRLDRELGMRMLGDRHVRQCVEAGYLSTRHTSFCKDVRHLLLGVHDLHANPTRSFEHAILPRTLLSPDDGSPLVVSYASERGGMESFFEVALVRATELICGQRIRLEHAAPEAGFTHAWRISVEHTLSPLRSPRRRSFQRAHEALLSAVSSAQPETPIDTASLDPLRLADDDAAPSPAAPAALGGGELENSLSLRRRRLLSAPSRAAAVSADELLKTMRLLEAPRGEAGVLGEIVLLDMCRLVHLATAGAPIALSALVRTIAPEHVAGSWRDPTQREAATAFWESNVTAGDVDAPPLALARRGARSARVCVARMERAGGLGGRRRRLAALRGGQGVGAGVRGIRPDAAARPRRAAPLG